MKFIPILFIFFSNAVLATQLPLDYDAIFKKSVSNSPQFKYINYQLKSKQELPAIQLGRLLPRIDISGAINSKKLVGGRTYGGQYITAPKVDSMKALVSLTQPLYDYGAYKDLQSSQEIALSAQQDYRSDYQQFIYDVSYAYFNLAKSIKNLEYLKYNVQANKRSYDEGNAQLKEGEADPADYETIKANLYFAEAEYAGAKRDVKVARAELKKFTNHNDNIILFSNAFKAKNPSPNNEQEWEQLTTRSNPNYLSAVHIKENKYYSYQSATSPFMPTVNFELKYSPGYNKIGSLGNQVFNRFLSARGSVNAFYFGLNVTWNILAGGTNYAQLKKAAYDYQSSEFDMIQFRRIAKNDVMNSFRFVQLKKKAIFSLRKSVAAAKIAYEKYREMYEEGETTLVQYFIVLNKYYQTLIRLNNTEFDYIMGFLSLYKTAGILTAKTVEDFNTWLL